MPELKWEAPASEDLMAIIGYIAEDNPVAAQALLDEIDDKVGRLPEHPKRCRPGRVEGTRELVVRPNYVVIYAEGPVGAETFTSANIPLGKVAINISNCTTT